MKMFWRSNHLLEWWVEKRIFVFLTGLNDYFENVRNSQFKEAVWYWRSLCSDFRLTQKDKSIKLWLARMWTCGLKGKKMRSALISCGSGSRSSRRCTHCKKSGYTIDFCWDLHPKKKNMRSWDCRNPSSQKLGAIASESVGTGDKSEGKKGIFGYHIRELQAYLNRLSSIIMKFRR